MEIQDLKEVKDHQPQQRHIVALSTGLTLPVNICPIRTIIEVDANRQLHDKACSFKTSDTLTSRVISHGGRLVAYGHSEPSDGQGDLYKPTIPIYRELFFIDKKRIKELLTSRLDAYLVPHTCEAKMESGYYLLSGLHCCGDLSIDALRLWLADFRAKYLVIASCCYHKMIASRPPLSIRLRNALQSQVNQPDSSTSFLPSFASIPSLRLACQWSPQQWLTWGPYEMNCHRLRTLFRGLLQLAISIYCHQETLEPKAFRRFSRSDPLSSVAASDKDCLYVEDLSLETALEICLRPHWNNLLMLKFSCGPSLINCEKNGENSIFLPSFDEIWSFLCLHKRPFYSLQDLWKLIPCLLALQQLVQPLLEAVILVDRVHWIHEECCDSVPLESIGLLRLFDPLISPRCLAIVACKA
ncbi:unnamed protein product [Protopolystoma xenopodis]|uniref:Methyltransferase domain-containing protein n=1 Tax=Protopolystoma xenopodis TaxID=117903 RepID=A0A3S5FG58_9PLAT|nr:unnamed protein product [Protopolystoma xenopodis]